MRKNLPFFTNRLCYRTELWTVNDHKITELVNMIKSCELSIAKITGFSQKSSVCLGAITVCAGEGPSGYYLVTSVLGLVASSGITGNGDTGHCWLSPASDFCKPVADLTQTVRQESNHSQSPSYQGINVYQYKVIPNCGVVTLKSMSSGDSRAALRLTLISVNNLWRRYILYLVHLWHI